MHKQAFTACKDIPKTTSDLKLSKMIRTMDIYDSPLIGVFATCTEDIAIVPAGTKSEDCKLLEEILDVQVIPTFANGCTVAGALIRGNSNGFLIPGNMKEDILKDIDLPVKPLPHKLNAIGNIVLSNDHAALVHPDLSDKAVEFISGTLGVDVSRGTIAGIKTVGMAGVVTNKGLIVNPRVSDSEIAHLEKTFDLPVGTGTVNYGTHMVGSGILANSKGYVTGSQTTGHELGRIDDLLEFV